MYNKMAEKLSILFFRLFQTTDLSCLIKQEINSSITRLSDAVISKSKLQENRDFWVLYGTCLVTSGY